MISLSNEVKADIEIFLDQNIDTWKDDLQPDEDGTPCMQLTIACNDTGDAWNYQTGDNSYTGGAYGLPHWAVTWITEDGECCDILEYIVEQLEELLAQ